MSSPNERCLGRAVHANEYVPAAHLSKNAVVLCAYWHRRPLCAGQYARALREYVVGLEQLSPAFSRMFVMGSSKADSGRLDLSLANLQELVLDRLPKDWSYQSADGKRMPLSAEAWTRNSFVNTMATALERETGGAVVETAMGSLDIEEVSSVIVRLRGAELASEEFLFKLFAHTVETWRPAYAHLEIEEPGGLGQSNPDEIPVGWLTYIETEKMVAGPAGTQVRRHGPGMLFEISGGAAPGQNPTFNQSLEGLQESLRAADLLDDPLAG